MCKKLIYVVSLVVVLSMALTSMTKAELVGVVAVLDRDRNEQKISVDAGQTWATMRLSSGRRTTEKQRNSNLKLFGTFHIPD